MISLNERQADALSELINMSFSLTAAKLSDLSGQRLRLDPPAIASHPIIGLGTELDVFSSGEVVSVHQAFSGTFSGDAILCLNSEGALKLSNLLVEENLPSPQLDISAGEILTEIGNMLLSACLGVFGNLLQVHVSFSVPVLHRSSFEQFLDLLTVSGTEMRHAIVIKSSFAIHENGPKGRIAIVLSLNSLEQLIQAVDQWDTEFQERVLKS